MYLFFKKYIPVWRGGSLGNKTTEEVTFFVLVSDSTFSLRVVSPLPNSCTFGIEFTVPPWTSFS